MSHTMLSETLPSAPANEPDMGFQRERERLHRQMLSAVSHDLKTPLASIIGSLEVYKRMKDKLSADKRTALIGVALQEAYRLDNFIVNILDMARLENGMVKINREDVEIGAMLRNCLTRMEGRLQGSSINMESVSGVIQITTDVVLLSRAVCLVLDNAVKYGGTPPAIRVEFGKNSGETAYIKVFDNGRGIPGEQMEKIFCKYTRLAREDQQNAGTGLGLAIAQTIMGMLDGGIAASNGPANGAVFTLHFPLA
ncbi:MAG: ATP-binding protein [Alphaproteobacteria bacterium]|nr:ATP-binding protein [Alphaproteobacteria bacterium]